MVAQESMERFSRSFASLALGFSGAAILALAGLHMLEPAFDPSWRMVSEYALGGSAWLLSVMFVCWTLSAAVLPYLTSRLSRLGAALLAVAGIGEFLAARAKQSHACAKCGSTVDGGEGLACISAPDGRFDAR